MTRPEAQDQDVENAEVAARIRLIMGAYTQSEIARRTGTPVYSVNRYLHGRAIPASFCSVLVKDLGIHPAWLLTGEGAMEASGVEDNLSLMTANLVDLTRAMEAASRMKLGARAGKKHLERLHDLQRAATSVQELQGHFRERVGPVLAALIGNLKRAVDLRKAPQALHVAEAMRQVLAAAPDVAMEMRVNLLEADACIQSHRVERAIELLEKSLFAAAGAELGADFWNSIEKYLTILIGQCRIAEARAIAGAAEALVSGQSSFAVQHERFALVRAWCAMETGGFQAKPFRLIERYQRLPREARDDFAPWFVRAGILSGVATHGSLREWLHDSEACGAEVIAYALTTGDSRILTEAIRRKHEAQSPWLSYLLDCARMATTAAPEKKKPDVNMSGLPKAVQPFIEATMNACLARGAAVSRNALFTASHDLDAMDRRFLPPFWFRAMHCRRIIATGEDSFGDAAWRRVKGFLRRFPVLMPREG